MGVMKSRGISERPLSVRLPWRKCLVGFCLERVSSDLGALEGEGETPDLGSAFLQGLMFLF